MRRNGETDPPYLDQKLEHLLRRSGLTLARRARFIVSIGRTRGERRGEMRRFLAKRLETNDDRVVVPGGPRSRLPSVDHQPRKAPEPERRNRPAPARRRSIILRGRPWHRTSCQAKSVT